MSQRDFAILLGVRTQQVSNVETGRITKIPRKMLGALTDADVARALELAGIHWSAEDLQRRHEEYIRARREEILGRIASRNAE